MSGALPLQYPAVPEPWPSWRRNRLLGEINALMIDAGLLRSVSNDARGESGVMHHFTQVYFDGDSQMVVDVYDRVSAVEVIATYTKSLDTRSKARIVSADEPTAFAAELAGKYRLALDTASDVEEMYKAWLGKPTSGS